MIRDGSNVSKNFKIADIDPKVDEIKNHDTISGKAMCVASGVL